MTRTLVRSLTFGENLNGTFRNDWFEFTLNGQSTITLSEINCVRKTIKNPIHLVMVQVLISLYLGV